MIDSRKLQSLRDRYANASGGDMFDPHFASVARSQFTSSDKREWPFAGIPTLLGAPCRPDAQELPDFGGLDVALVGVPMDLGVTNRNGEPLRPARAAHHRADRPLRSRARNARRSSNARSPTSAMCRCRAAIDLDLCHADIEAFYSAAGRGGRASRCRSAAIIRSLIRS